MQKNKSLLDRLFFAFFVVSLYLIAFLWGWFTVFWTSTILLALFMTVSIIFAFFIGQRIGKKKIPFASPLIICSWSVVFFLFGTQIGMHNWFQLNSWIRGSVEEVQEILEPENKEDAFSDPEDETWNTVGFKGTQGKKVIEGFKVNFEDIDYPLFVVFDKPNEMMLIQKKGEEVEFQTLEKTHKTKQQPMVIHGNEFFNETFTGDSRFDGRNIVKTKLNGKVFAKGWEHHTMHNFHHWGDYFEEKAYMLGYDFYDAPNAVTKMFEPPFGECKFHNAMSDKIVQLDWETGEVLEEIPLLPLLVDLPEKEISTFLADDCQDPIHTNDVRVIKTQKHADFFPNGKVGDMIVSLRDIYTIALIDRDTHKIKWHVFGKSHYHHSPRITNRGTLVVFDNLGSTSIKNGVTRVTEIDIKTKEIVGFFEASDEEMFHSKIRGRLQVLDDRIFVQEHEQGNLFEIICSTKYLDTSCEKKYILKRESKLRKMYLAEFLDTLETSKHEKK